MPLITLLKAACSPMAASQPTISDRKRAGPWPNLARPSDTPTSALVLLCINEVEKARETLRTRLSCPWPWLRYSRFSAMAKAEPLAKP